MERKKGYTFLEHTADAYIAAYGKDLAEAFENAAVAMFDVMTTVEKVSPQVEDSVEVSGEDEHALLYNWLEELLVKAEVEGMLYSKFKILELTRDNGAFRLKARIWGEKFSPEKHVQKVGVKAITYHQMEIIRDKDKATVKFILDI
ncbi:MAG: archease [Candidatus Bathyarchaeota archaeon]|nr:archease [Candidatus Bathyarchaeota archaeon]MDW8040856.1 archease [Nitrososphaerota archaeon]